MANKKQRIMTVEELFRFCVEQNFAKFDSTESGYQLYVSTPAQFEVSESEDEYTLFANIKAFHTNNNRNKSSVTKKAMEKSLSGFKYKPILCNYQTVTLEDGTEALDFTAHDMEIDEDGNPIYLEKQVGCITADKPEMRYDEKTDRYYAYAKGAIPREYTPAAEIIERRGGTDVSAELFVNKMSYDAKKKELLLEDIELGAITLLGSDRTPGMEGAHLQIEDFAVNEKDSYEQNDKLIETLNALNKTLESFNINNAERKEEKPMDKFTELLEKYGKTVEDVTFAYEGMSDEELETAFKEAFEEEVVDEPERVDEESDSENEDIADFADDDPTDDPSEDTTDSTDEGTDDGSEDDSDEESEEVVIDDDVAPRRRQNNEVEFSAVVNGEVKTFSVSLVEKLNALRDLVNNTYADSDNTWYDVDAYDDDKYVVMHDYWNNKHYRQNYSVKKDVYSLKGDRVEVFARFLTQDEINNLDSIKSNYEQISNDLAQYQKKELVASADYSAISNKEEFTAIVNEVNEGKNEMTFEELKDSLDKMLLSYAKSGNLNFEEVEKKEEEAKNSKKKVSRVGLMASGAKGNPKRSRYGNIFKK